MPKATEHLAYLEKSDAERELDSYIFGGRFGRRSVPTLARPEPVESFIRRKLDRSRSSGDFFRARRVVDYFDLGRVVNHFEELLDRREQDDSDLERSCRCAMVLADQGDPGQIRFGIEYLMHLMGHRQVIYSSEPLVETIGVFHTPVDTSVLEQRLRAHLDALAPRLDSDPNADNEYQELDQVLFNYLPAMHARKAEVIAIQSIDDPARRIDELCRLYVEWQRYGDAESVWWTARHLRHDVRAGHKKAIVDTLSAILDEIAAAKLDEAERNFHRVRVLRALSFLGESLNPSQHAFLAQHGQDQSDVLYREAP